MARIVKSDQVSQSADVLMYSQRRSTRMPTMVLCYSVGASRRTPGRHASGLSYRPAATLRGRTTAGNRPQSLPLTSPPNLWQLRPRTGTTSFAHGIRQPGSACNHSYLTSDLATRASRQTPTASLPRTRPSASQQHARDTTATPPNFGTSALR